MYLPNRYLQLSLILFLIIMAGGFTAAGVKTGSETDAPAANRPAAPSEVNVVAGPLVLTATATITPEADYLLYLSLIEKGALSPTPTPEPTPHQCPTYPSYALADETVTLIEEWSAPTGYLINSDHQITPVSTFNDSAYVVWVDVDGHPNVTKVTDGQADTGRLDPNDDYKVRDDGHHKYSLGIDNDGYIHIVGDMHHHPHDNVDHLPERYKTGTILYWVSDRPEDVSSFTYLGEDTNRRPPGSGFTYLFFINDNDGHLYFGSRYWVAEVGGWLPGKLGVGLARYETEAKSWTALGALPPVSGAVEKAVAWEDNGADKTAYQIMQPDVKFDARNRLHFSLTINADDSYNGSSVAGSMTHVIYAYSDDGGQTFYRADGSPIDSLPLRAEAGSGQADVIAEVHWLNRASSADMNRNCQPFVTFNDWSSGGGILKYSRWTPEQGWSAPQEAPVNALRKRQYLDKRGVITLFDTSPPQVYRFLEWGEPGRIHSLPLGFDAIDRRYWRETGEFRGLAVNDGKIHLIRLEITP